VIWARGMHTTNLVSRGMHYYLVSSGVDYYLVSSGMHCYLVSSGMHYYLVSSCLRVVRLRKHFQETSSPD